MHESVGFVITMATLGAILLLLKLSVDLNGTELPPFSPNKSFYQQKGTDCEKQLKANKVSHFASPHLVIIFLTLSAALVNGQTGV